MEDSSILKLFFFGIQAPLWIKAFAFLLQVTYRWDLAAAGSIIKGRSRFCTFVYCIIVCVMGLFWHIQNRGQDKKGSNPGYPGRNQTVALLCFSEPMLQSACVVSGDSVHAVTLITALQKALHMVRRTHLCSVDQF